MILIFGAAAIVLAKPQPLLSSVLIGISYCAVLINMQFNDIQYLKLQNSSITGTIISLPEQRKYNNRFFFELSKIDSPHLTRKSTALLLVYWPGQHQLMQGQQLRLKVDVRPVHGLANQGGFNYQKWLLSQGIVATAKVSHGEIINAQPAARALLMTRLSDMVTNLQYRQFIRALALADKSGFSRPDWQLLSATGTSHLFAISGLHLAIVFGLSFSLFRVVLTIFSSLIKSKYSQQLITIATICSLLVALSYSYLAGFSLPTVRALVMLSVIAGASLLKQRLSLVQLLLYSLAGVLIFDPLAVLAMSFWLSFCAVACLMLLLFFIKRDVRVQAKSMIKLRHKAVALGQMQLWLFVTMCGLQLVFFAGFSLTAPLANLVAVPAVSLIILPLILLGLLSLVLVPSSSLAMLIFEIANRLLGWLFSYLDWLAHFPHTWVATSKLQYWLLAVILLVVVCGFRLMNTPRMRLSALILVCFGSYATIELMPSQLLPSQLMPSELIPGQFNPSERPSWAVHVLDVGQGNAAVVIRNGRAIVFDTGKARTTSLSTLVILPFLQHHAINTVDYVILSHQDNDHAGGWRDLLDKYPQAQLISNWPNKPNHHLIIDCASLQASPVKWQGLNLTFFIAPSQLATSENNRSCITQVTDNQQGVLFTGDISKKIEHYVATELGRGWQSDILIVPHHGSATSSSAEFINFVAPQLAVVSAGRFNQWHFPRQAVLDNYRQAEVEVVTTARSGQITIDFYPDRLFKIKPFRSYISPFWYNKYRDD